MSAVVDFPARPETRPYLGIALGHAEEPDWLARHRRRSLARFAEQGFPNRRGEAWRYLDLRPLEQSPLLPAAADGAIFPAPTDDIGFAGAAHRLVLLDGRFTPELSVIAGLPAGIWCGSTATAIGDRPELVREAFEVPWLDRDRSFTALNGAFFTDGFVLDVAPGVILDRPVQIVHLSSGAVAGSLHTRSLVALGAESRVRLIESFAGQGRYWRNDVITLRLAAGADLNRVALVEEAADALHFGEISAVLGTNSRLDSFVLLLSGRTVRHEVTVHSAGESAHCSLYGAFLVSDHQQANIVTTVDHSAPGGETREVFKGVASGHAHGAFQGRITVRPDAQKVDAQMQSRNLLLGRHAVVDTKPELEILADDVKCGHGATVGDLDDAALFYLLARGIPRSEARRMLIEAFLREAIEIVDPPPLREHLQSRLTRRLAMLEI